jgi:rSAM/selenodomain-associated transferase 1
MNASCVIIFLKAPIPGNVKSRLAASIGPEHAANLYACFIKDIIRTAKQTRMPLKIFYDPPESSSFIEQMLGDELDYQVQSGTHLGEKMANGFYAVFEKNYKRAVLVGSDIPNLPETLLIEAMTALSHHDAVIGPSYDGGYYLIGFQATTFTSDVFRGIAWSTDRVYAQTKRKLAARGLDTYILPQWRDVDTYEDLMDLKGALLGSKSSAQTTYAYLVHMDHRAPTR